MKQFRKFVLLADVDNTQVTVEELKKIIDKTETLGDLIYIKLYGVNDKKSKEFAEIINGKCCDTAPVLRTKIRSRKSVLDTRIMVDAMKISCSKIIDGFAIVAGDGDFGYLLSALKADGKFIAGKFISDVNITFCDTYFVDFEETKTLNIN